MAKRISQEIKDKIVEKIKNDGLSAGQAAKEFGISANTIYNSGREKEKSVPILWKSGS